MKSVLTLGLALSLALAAPLTVQADPKHCPPGHAKKGWCGDNRHSRDRERTVVREYVVIRDHERYGLRPPRSGYFYGIYNDEVYLLSEATRDIIEGLGAVDLLLRRYGG